MYTSGPQRGGGIIKFMSNHNDDRAKLITETMIEEIEKDNEGLIHLLLENTPPKITPETSKIVTIIFTMLVHSIHKLMILQIVSMENRKPDKAEIEALYTPAKAETERRIEKYITNHSNGKK